MFWNVNETAEFLGVKPHQVYYLLSMGTIEGVKVGSAWRVVSGGARAYGGRVKNAHKQSFPATA